MSEPSRPSVAGDIGVVMLVLVACGVLLFGYAVGYSAFSAARPSMFTPLR